tara:strand:- start:1596 stop:1946 length:351 start_codon:yes stop_codon:yes gene_type:complete
MRSSNPSPPVQPAEQVDFNTLDTDNSGDVTAEEVKTYNEVQSKAAQQPDSDSPLKVLVWLVVLMAVIVGGTLFGPNCCQLIRDYIKSRSKSKEPVDKEPKKTDQKTDKDKSTLLNG